MAQGRFVSGELKRFSGGGRRLAVDVILPAALAANFEVVEKEYLPENTTRPDGARLIWVNNIGLQPIGSPAEVNDYYEVQISRAGVNLSRIEKVFIYVNNQAQALSAADFDLDFSGKVALRLNLIDPPIGLDGR